MRMFHSFWPCFVQILLLILPLDSLLAQTESTLDKIPFTDITKRKIAKERKPLAYPAIDERDIFWEKRVVRVINFREKMNLYFQSPKSQFMEIVFDGLKSGNLKAYSAEGDAFAHRLDNADLNSILSRVDTVEVENLDSGLSEMKVITDDLNLNEITELRIEEIWFFDSKYSKTQLNRGCQNK